MRRVHHQRGAAHDGLVVVGQVVVVVLLRRAQALLACAALAVTGLSRVDFFYEEASDRIWINEINTLPGFTSQSMYPMLWAASGLTLDQLVHQLIQTAGE